MDPLEQAILQNSEDLGVDPGVALEQDAARAAEAKSTAVKAPPVYKNRVDVDPDIAKLDAEMGLDPNELTAAMNDQALVEHEASVNEAVTEYLKKGSPAFDEEGRALGTYIKSLIAPKEPEKQSALGRAAEYTASALANTAMVPGKWLESATNTVADVINYVGRKYNWNGGSDVLGTMDYFKSAQQQLPDGQVPAKLIEYMAPTVGLIGKGASLAKAVTMGGAISSVVVDPDDKRLSDMVKGTWMEKVPLVAEAIDYLAYDPSDSNLTKRWKNALEGMGVDIAVASGVGMVRAVRADAKAEARAMNDALDPVEKELQVKAGGAPKAPATPAPKAPEVQVAPEAPDQVVASQRATLQELGAAPSPAVVSAEAELAAAAKEPGEAVRAYKTKLATQKLAKAQEAHLDDLARARLNGTPEMQAAYIERAEKVVADTAEAVGITKAEADGLASSLDEVFEPVAFKANNSEATSTLGRLFKTITETEQARGPMTLADMYAMGGTLKEDVDFLEQVAGRQLGDLMHAEGTVAIKSLLGDMWDDFAAAARATDRTNPASVAKTAEAFENMQRLSNIASGYSEEAARTLGIHKHINSLIDAGNAEAIAMVRGQMASKIVMDRISSAGGISKIENLAALIDEADAIVKDMTLSINAKGELYNVGKFAKLADGIISYINTARLNSVSLLGRIGTSSTIMSGRRLLTNLNEAIIGGIVGRDEGPTIAGVFADANGMIAARSEAAEAAYQTWKTGASKGPTVNMDLEQLRVSALPALGGENIAAQAYNKAGVLLASGRRGIMTVEAATGMLNYRGHVAGAAQVAAERAGLTGQARKEFVENFMANPPRSVHDSAVEAVEAINLTGEVQTKWISRLTNPAEGMGRYHPFTIAQKLMAPFANTRGRFLEEALTNVPIANFLVKDNWRKLTAGTKAERVRLAGELATGMETIGVIGYLIQNGLLTGGPAPDFKTQKLLSDSEQGYKPYSVRVGDKFVEIPFADNTLKKIIDVSAYVNYAATSAMEEQEHGEALTLAAMAVGHVLSPDDNLRTGGQITSVVRGILEGQDMTEQAKSLLAGPLVGLNPLAGVTRDYNQAFGDNTQKDYKSAESLMDYLKMRMEATLPGLSQNVPPARNIFGEPVLTQTGKALFGSFLASQDTKGDDVMERLRLLSGYYDMAGTKRQADTVKFTLSEPQREIDVMGVPVELTPAEYDEYAYRVGQEQDAEGLTLKDRFYNILVDQASPVFEYVASYGKIMPEDYDNDRMSMEYSSVMAAVVSNYKQRQDALALEFADRPEIRERAMEIIRHRNESAVKGFQTIEKFMGVR